MAKNQAMARPTRTMQEAINLALDGKRPAALKKLKEDDRNTPEAFEHFLKLRQDKGLGPYTFTRAEQKPRGVKPVFDDALSKIDGRTKTAVLVKLEARVQELLAQKPKEDVAAVRDALKNVDRLSKELEEAKALLGM